MNSKIIQTHLTPSAILDIHFTKRSDGTYILGAATSTGSIELYTVALNASSPPKIVHESTLQFFPSDTLITAFNWHPDGTTLGMTLSNGEVWLSHSEHSPNDTDAQSCHQILRHDLEAWTLAFLPDASCVLSGGDDCTLRFVEIPKNPIDGLKYSEEAVYEHVRRTPWADTKIHGAGVTAILPIHIDEAGILVITGSYDDHVRLILIPTVGRRRVLAEQNLGGGVWRFKILDTKSTDGRLDEMVLLVSCMYAGARIVKVSMNKPEYTFEVLAKFEEHKSMNYGCDAQPDVDRKGRRTIVSTSFYDRMVCVWKYGGNEEMSNDSS